MGIQYEKQAQPIYKWTLMSNGKIKKAPPITEYKVRSSGNNTRYYMRVSDGSVNSVREEKFDCFKNSTVYSFNGDDARAHKLIRDALEAKVNISRKEYEKALEDLTKFDNAQMQ